MRRLGLLLFIAAHAAACGEPPPSCGKDVDGRCPGDKADSATDTDTGTDSGLESDSGSDSDSGADSDADTPVDGDGDGYVAAEDCDDTDPTVNPGVRETCGNGIDDDCDGGAGNCGMSGFHDLLDDHGGVVRGTYDGSEAGKNIDGCSDLDDDGIHDLVVSNYSSDRTSFVFLGGPDGEELLDDADFSIEFGTYTPPNIVCARSDLGGDGGSDLVVAGEYDAGYAQDYFPCDTTYGDCHAVLVFHSPVEDSLGSLHGETDAAFILALSPDGHTLGTYFEVAVGDVTGDAEADFIATNPESLGLLVVAGPVSPGAYDLLETSATTITSDREFRTVSAGDDVDGDGVGDLLVGDPESSDCGEPNCGALAIFFGPVGSQDIQDADSTMLSEEQSHFLGTSPTAAQDLDGDGRNDVVTGSTSVDADNGSARGGAVYVVTDVGRGVVDVGSRGSRYRGSELNGYCGYALSSPGDVTGDGRPDLVVGCMGEDSLAGAIYVVEGPAIDGGLLADSFGTFRGERQSNAGFAVAGIGDLDGDRDVEVLVAAPEEDHDDAPYPENEEEAGAVYPILGGADL